MTNSAFNDALRTGNENIDGQHQGLFDLSARVAQRVRVCEGEATDAACRLRNDDAVAEAVYGLLDYITEHFSDEEQIMAEAGFPMTSLHRALHEDLAKRVSALVVRYMSGEQMAAQELSAFFDDWLTTHIMGHDQEFAHWVNQRGQR